jgi:hypothetical protein
MSALAREHPEMYPDLTSGSVMRAAHDQMRENERIIREAIAAAPERAKIIGRTPVASDDAAFECLDCHTPILCAMGDGYYVPLEDAERCGPLEFVHGDCARRACDNCPSDEDVVLREDREFNAYGAVAPSRICAGCGCFLCLACAARHPDEAACAVIKAARVAKAGAA